MELSDARFGAIHVNLGKFNSFENGVYKRKHDFLSVAEADVSILSRMKYL